MVVVVDGRGAGGVVKSLFLGYVNFVCLGAWSNLKYIFVTTIFLV